MILIAATFYYIHAFSSTLTVWKSTSFHIQLKSMGKDMNIANLKFENWDPKVLNVIPYDHLNVRFVLSIQACWTLVLYTYQDGGEIFFFFNWKKTDNSVDKHAKKIFMK